MLTDNYIMAAAEQGGSLVNKRRSSCSDIFRPDLSELRVVLLGNSWSLRSSVGNLLLNKDVFDVDTPAQRSLKESVTLNENTLTVINTPDLLHPDITVDKLTDLVKDMSDLSQPGPHVFLLVLHTHSFTEQQQRRTKSILEKFTEQAFNHSLILLSDQEQSGGSQEVLMEMPRLKEMLVECRYRYTWMKNLMNEDYFKRAELLTKLGQIVREDSGHYLNYEAFEDTASTVQTKHGTSQKEISYELVAQVQSLGIKADPAKCTASEDVQRRILRILIINKKKSFFFKFFPGSSKFYEKLGKNKIVTTLDLTGKCLEDVREMKRCVEECHPGPNVLLLFVKPSDFTEKNRETLKSILTWLGPTALKHCIVVSTHEGQMTESANNLLRDCEGRYYEMFREDSDQLMKIMETLVDNNHGSFVSFNETQKSQLPLNLLFYERKGSGKTSAAKAILGQTPCYEASECIRRQGEVSGWSVSIVELPALSGRPPKEVMEQCLSAVSLCDPEGVHAFVMVLPVAHLTDVDKAEFRTIQNTFGSRIDNYTVVLFTVESDSSVRVFEDFVKQHKDIQELCQSCGGRYMFFNIKDKHQVPQLLEKVEQLTKLKKKPHSYTTRSFAQTQIERFFTDSTWPELSLLDRGRESRESPESLRIVLIGKTGSGKSSSGNTILGRGEFKCDWGQKSVTKFCQKEDSNLNNRRIDVLDTPGLFDNTMSNCEVNDEMVKCISLLAPGPHVFLLVLQIGRFTPEENETLNLIKKGFGKDAQKYTIVLFTHGDELDKHKTPIEDYIKNKCDDSCKKLIADCGGRYHVFDNNSPNNKQVNDLIQKIDEMVKANGGSCYTNEMLQKAEAAIQKEAQRLMKEREEELKKEHKEEMKELKTRMEKEREKTERERQQKDEKLREMEANIKQMQELREREKQTREEEELAWKEKEEVKRQIYEQNFQELEEKLQKNYDGKLQENKETMEDKQKAWERERKEWWENRNTENKLRQFEEQDRLEKLKQQYNDELTMFQNKEAEAKIRCEQEEKNRQELEKKHQKEMEDLRRSYEEEARKTAEEFNEFKEKMKTDFAAEIEKHLQEATTLKEEIQQKRSEYQSLQDLKTHNENVLKSEMMELQDNHKQQLITLAIEVLMETKENTKAIRDAQKRHKQERDQCEKTIKRHFKNKLEIERHELKEKQHKEMKDLKSKTNKEDLGQRRNELSYIHKKRLEELESDLWHQQKQQLKEKLDKLNKQHEDELNRITEDLLKENKNIKDKQIAELEKTHKQEMDEFLKNAGEKESDVELDKLKTKHQQEMEDIKKRMLPDTWCAIL